MTTSTPLKDNINNLGSLPKLKRGNVSIMTKSNRISEAGIILKDLQILK